LSSQPGAARAVELGGDLAARRAFAHHAGVGARAQHQLQRVDQDGLAGAGFAGEHGEAGCSRSRSRRTMTKSRSTVRLMPAHDTTGPFVPVQLLAQGVEIAPAHRVQQAQLVLERRTVMRSPCSRLVKRLHVEVGAGVAAGHHFDRDLAGGGQHDGPVGQGVRRDRHHHPAADGRVQQRPAGRQRVGGGAGGRGDDQAVGALVGHEVAVHLHPQLHHAGRAAAVDHHVVHGGGLEHAAAVAPHAGRIRLRWSSSYSPRRMGQQWVSKSCQRNVGDEAQPALVDAHQRHP
jgi:hypothetical protein